MIIVRALTPNALDSSCFIAGWASRSFLLIDTPPILLLVVGIPPSPLIPTTEAGLMSANHHPTRYPSRMVCFAIFRSCADPWNNP